MKPEPITKPYSAMTNEELVAIAKHSTGRLDAYTMELVKRLDTLMELNSFLIARGDSN